MKTPQLSRRHLLTKIVPGVSVGVLGLSADAVAQDRVVFNGRLGYFHADQQPVPKQVAKEGKPDPLEKQQTERYEDLTAAEMVSMTVGVPLQAKENHQAARIMQLSLDLEHFISVIPLDKSQVNQETRDEIRMLRDQLTELSGVKVLLHLFNELPNDTGFDPAFSRRSRR